METENKEDQQNRLDVPEGLEFPGPVRQVTGRRQDYRRGMRSGILGTLLCVAAVAAAAAVGVQAGRSAGTKNGKEDSAESTKDAISTDGVKKKSDEIADLIDQYYYEDIDESALVEGMYAGLVNGLGDKYSNYFTAEEYTSFNTGTTGTYYGIGAVLSQNINTQVVTILHVYPGSPAEEAGVRDGDVIVKVEDIAGDSMELSELVQHIKGEEGSTVHLELMRENEAEHLQFDVERRKIDVPTVEHQMLENHVGLIQISEFAENTPEQFDAAIQELKGQGMTSMIVDLRDNPGGVLQSVCEMLDEILPEGTLVYTEDKQGNRKDYNSDPACMDIPMAVLVNENSASASEIFAGAIKDYQYGTLIGTKTFGKGIVQTIIPLKDGSAVKLTMAKYFTPKGNYIHGAGIEPDVELEYEYQSPEDETYQPMHDNQILKALEILVTQ